MGFETLKNIIRENKEEARIAQEENMNPTECPTCAWTLDVNGKGEKSCPICGRIWKP